MPPSCPSSCPSSSLAAFTADTREDGDDLRRSPLGELIIMRDDRDRPYVSAMSWAVAYARLTGLKTKGASVSYGVRILGLSVKH